MRILLWGLLAALVVLHHDFWFWTDPTLLFGWCPIGLAWHVGLSVAASVFWLAVVKLMWPRCGAAGSAVIAGVVNADSSPGAANPAAVGGRPE